MSSFLAKAEERVKVLKKDLKDMETSLHAAIKYYAMDPRKVSSEDFFCYIVKFIAMFEKALKENATIREAKKKEEMRKALEEATKLKREESKKSNAKKDEKGAIENVTAKDEKLILDNLLISMQKGDFGGRKIQGSRKNNTNKVNLSTASNTNGLQKLSTSQLVPSQNIMQPTNLRPTPKQDSLLANSAHPTSKIQSNTSFVPSKNNESGNSSQYETSNQREQQNYFQKTSHSQFDSFSNVGYGPSLTAKHLLTNAPTPNTDYTFASSQPPSQYQYTKTKLSSLNEGHVLGPYNFSTNVNNLNNNIIEEPENAPPPPPRTSTRHLSTSSMNPLTQNPANQRNSYQPPVPKRHSGMAGDTNGTSSGHNTYLKTSNIMMTSDLNQGSKNKNSKQTFL